MNQLKKLVINETLEKFEKVYIHALPHPKLLVGERGLINSEKNNGIVLAIGSASCKEFTMDDNFMYAMLRFNGVWENVVIPYESVDAVLNDLNKPLCIFNFPFYEESNIINTNTHLNKNIKHENQQPAVIVRADFTKKQG